MSQKAPRDLHEQTNLSVHIADKKKSSTTRLGLITDQFKVCFRCKKNKILKDFGVDRKRKDGVHPWCRECSKTYLAARRDQYRERKNKRAREQHKEQRLRVLQHYSKSDIPFCACCLENLLEFLGIDHINGGGGRDKKIHKCNFYTWLEKLGYPNGFRVLCHNCNQSLGAYGYCPHQMEQRAAASN